MERIKKVLQYPCYCCTKSIRGKTKKKSSCPDCKGTGFFEDEIYYVIITTKNGKKICFDGDTAK